MIRTYVLVLSSITAVVSIAGCATGDPSPEGPTEEAAQAVSVDGTPSVVPPPLGFMTCQQVFTETDPGLCTASGPKTIITHQTMVPATCVQDPPGPYPVGVTLVALTCTSDTGISRTCHEKVTVTDTNPPVIACPADQTLTCSGALASSAAASAQTKCSGQPIASVSCSSPLDAVFTQDAVVTCSATGPNGLSSSCSFDVDVQPGAPQVATAAAPVVLWPPNHKYHAFDLKDCVTSVKDACGNAYDVGEVGSIVRVTSDEVEDAPGNGENGDGHTCDDMVITSSTGVDLRSERDGTGDGRVYRIHFAVETAGGVAYGSCTAVVPHDMSAAAQPVPEGSPAFCVGSGCPGSTGVSSCH